MKVSRVRKNGRIMYRVHWKNPAKTTGDPYTRSFFSSLKNAETFAAETRRELQDLGRNWLTIPPADRAEAAEALAAASAAGVPLRQLVAEALAARARGPSMTVSDLFTRCLESKVAIGCRPRSVRALRSTLQRFAQRFGARAADSITPLEVGDYLATLQIAPRSRRGALVNLGTAFSYGVQIDVLKANPCAKVQKPRVEAAATTILSPETAARLFQTCEQQDPALLGFLALAAFGGFRPESEVARMTREDVIAGLEAGFLRPPAMNKTRRTRLVPVTPCLRAWLDVWLPLGVPVVPISYRGRLQEVRAAAGLADWPQNVLRHSRVSYRLAETGDAAQTALEDGHSQEQLHRHYKALVTPEAAARYFSIRPTPGLDLAALAAAADARRARGTDGRTYTAEAMRQRSLKRWRSPKQKFPDGTSAAPATQENQAP